MGEGEKQHINYRRQRAITLSPPFSPPCARVCAISGEDEITVFLPGG